MLLESSSTPVLGSLISSFPDSPSKSNTIHSETSHALKHLPATSVPQIHHKLSLNRTGSPSLSSFSCNSSPISPSIAHLHKKGFRRVQSEVNLEDLAYGCRKNNNEDQINDTDPPKRFSARLKCLRLQTILSLSFYDYNGMREEDEEVESDTEDGEERQGLEEEKGTLHARIEERAMAEKGDDGYFSLENRVVNGMILAEKVRVKHGFCKVGFADQEEVGGIEMYLARGLDIDGCGDGIGGCRGSRGSGGDYNSMDGSGKDDGDKQNPGNALFLRNYSQFLYQCEQDRQGADEYYSRALLADPEDGEVVSQHGKLVWEIHHDQDRASSYFERAIQASPEDSHVHAAYASFLWDTEEDEVDCNEPKFLPPHFHQGAMAIGGTSRVMSWDEEVIE